MRAGAASNAAERRSAGSYVVSNARSAILNLSEPPQAVLSGQDEACDEWVALFEIHACRLKNGTRSFEHDQKMGILVIIVGICCVYTVSPPSLDATSFSNPKKLQGPEVVARPPISNVQAA
ncbi:hypothetical protein SODALDRAFT_108032 [Sodiomyces alkalinus F11]|uniref:Uncharacterized protein n=1 Tax=Sodiomyces alkalinus (strain CBS 110278 / VKM F-3762 / F11) TaxID=1314773 RepID=A0A3N2Q2C8_SODAK|nr:hypothetical protein SODALDRAFT_108032 [Sodiomyces alkalinus F11]ROT40923.1 hypothetical protein SODALDRAFT_108032 [Sodiomyces alkalinus F11]